MKKVKIILLWILISLSWKPTAFSKEISDMGAAIDWCDQAMLDRIEGIWEYPSDYTSVLIRKSNTEKGHYDILVVESADTRLNPGDKIGYLKSSPDPDKFEMGLYRTKLESGVFAELGKCLAQFNEGKDALLTQGRGIKFSLGSRYLLPSFWKLVRISVKDPLSNLPKGLVRIYPKTKRLQPDYL